MSHDEKYLLCEYNHKMRRCATVIMGEEKNNLQALFTQPVKR